MKFCDRCGKNLLRVVIEDEGRFLHCTSCNRKIPLTEEIKITTSHKKKEQKVVIVDEKEQNTFPITKIVCPRCNEMREAYWTMQQTRGGDEPPTRFYECKTCKWRWREYS